MEISFHLRKIISLKYQSSQGPVSEDWNLAVGISGPIDPESGMIVNLVHVEKNLNDLIQKYSGNNVFTFAESIPGVFSELQTDFSKFKNVHAVDLELSDLGQSLLLQYSQQKYIFNFISTVVWEDSGHLSRRRLRWTWTGQKLEHFLSQDTLQHRSIDRFEIQKCNEEEIERLLTQNGMISVAVEDTPGKTWRTFKR